MEIAAWTSFAFTGLLLVMTISRHFFHEWLTGELVLGPVGWGAMLTCVPGTVAIWVIAMTGVMGDAAISPAVALPVIFGLLIMLGAISAVEIFQLFKVVANTDNKTNLLVSVANRVNDVEVYLRILHYNLQSERRPSLPADVRETLAAAGVLPRERTVSGAVEDITEEDLAEGDSDVRTAEELGAVSRTPVTEVVAREDLPRIPETSDDIDIDNARELVAEAEASLSVPDADAATDAAENADVEASRRATGD